jgi:hypothetical protein
MLGDTLAEIALDSDVLTYEAAKAELRRGVPKEHDNRTWNYRRALATRIKELALFNLFSVFQKDETLQKICSNATVNVQILEIFKGIEAHLYKTLNISDRTDLHPKIAEIQEDTIETLDRVILSLECHFESNDDTIDDPEYPEVSLCQRRRYQASSRKPRVRRA